MAGHRGGGGVAGQPVLKGVKMELAVGKVEEYVGDRGRAGEGRDKQ